MSEAQSIQTELPNLVTLFADKFKDYPFAKHLYLWENIIFSILTATVIIALAYFATRKRAMVPGRLQSAFEALIGGLDDFICSILGPKGRKFTPFVATLFIYILFMNLSGLIPLIKSATSNWSVTLALALCVFIYVQYSAIQEHGLLGYLDHLAGRPRGVLAWSAVFPLMMFLLHILSEAVKPVSLSLRLRSNIWGDDLLLTLLAQFGLKGVPILLFNMFSVILASVVQAAVFCLLTVIYFVIALAHEEKTA